MSSQSMRTPTSEVSSAPRPARTWEQTWMTIKLLFLFGAGFGGLWLLDQIVAQ
jgi:hypothetical protein